MTWRCEQGPVSTIADGLMTVLGTHTFPAVMGLVDRIVTVSESEIASAVRLVRVCCFNTLASTHRQG